MVPLPEICELRPIELIVPLIRTGRWRAMSGVWFDPSARSALEITGQAKVRPAVLPSDGREAGDAAKGVIVHHRKAPPLAFGCVDNAALMQRHAADRVGIRR